MDKNIKEVPKNIKEKLKEIDYLFFLLQGILFLAEQYNITRLNKVCLNTFTGAMRGLFLKGINY